MHVQRMISDITCLLECASPDFLILTIEIAKILKSVGNLNASGTHVITMSLAPEDYGAVGARSSNVAILFTQFQETYILSHSRPKQVKLLEIYVATDTSQVGKFIRSFMAP